MSMKNPIREKLDRGGLLLCMMLRQSDMAAAEIAAQYGIDMLCIDNEHYPFDEETMIDLVRPRSTVPAWSSASPMRRRPGWPR